MLRSLTVIAAATTLLAAGTATAQASPSARKYEPRIGKFTVVERAITDTTTDTGAKGDSVGDILTFANPIYDRANRHKIGSDNGYCIRTVVGKAYECSWTTTLRGGSLTVQGPFYDTHDSVLAITGGTGRWSKARGQMRLHARDAKSTSYNFAFDVQR